MKKIYVIGICSGLSVLVFFALMGSLPAIAQEGALDGKTFVGDMGEKGKEKGDKDELVFKDGKFRSVACFVQSHARNTVSGTPPILQE